MWYLMTSQKNRCTFKLVQNRSTDTDVLGRGRSNYQPKISVFVDLRMRLNNLLSFSRISFCTYKRISYFFKLHKYIYTYTSISCTWLTDFGSVPHTTPVHKPWTIPLKPDLSVRLCTCVFSFVWTQLCTKPCPQRSVYTNHLAHDRSTPKGHNTACIHGDRSASRKMSRVQSCKLNQICTRTDVLVHPNKHMCAGALLTGGEDTENTGEDRRQKRRRWRKRMKPEDILHSHPELHRAEGAADAFASQPHGFL